jgi:hypothetical protein
MQKTVCAIFLIFLSVMNIAFSANHIAMDYPRILHHSSTMFKFHSASRPKVDKNNKDKTTLEEDMKSLDQSHNKAPTINAEDRVIEFIVTDIGR